MISESLEILISVLHPTRRCSEALARKQGWMDMAAKPESIEWIFGIDEGDTSCDPLKEHDHVVVPPPTWDVSKEGGTLCLAMNMMAEKAKGELLFQMADDWFGPYHWDAWFLEVMSAHMYEPKMLTLPDHPGRPAGFDLCCFPLITRKLYEKNGHFYYPEYRHVYVDTDISLRTRRFGQRVDVPVIPGFFHDHPFLTGKSSDEVYNRANSKPAYEYGEAIYKKRNGHLL